MDLRIPAWLATLLCGVLQIAGRLPEARFAWMRFVSALGGDRLSSNALAIPDLQWLSLPRADQCPPGNVLPPMTDPRASGHHFLSCFPSCPKIGKLISHRPRCDFIDCLSRPSPFISSVGLVIRHGSVIWFNCQEYVAKFFSGVDGL